MGRSQQVSLRSHATCVGGVAILLITSYHKEKVCHSCHKKGHSSKTCKSEARGSKKVPGGESAKTKTHYNSCMGRASAPIDGASVSISMEIDTGSAVSIWSNGFWIKTVAEIAVARLFGHPED